MKLYRDLRSYSLLAGCDGQIGKTPDWESDREKDRVRFGGIEIVVGGYDRDR